MTLPEQSYVIFVCPDCGRLGAERQRHPFRPRACMAHGAHRSMVPVYVDVPNDAQREALERSVDLHEPAEDYFARIEGARA